MAGRVSRGTGGRNESRLRDRRRRDRRTARNGGRAERLELRISVDNVASKRVAERCGYTRDGVLRSLYVKEGLREDTEVWSRLPGDPPAG